MTNPRRANSIELEICVSFVRWKPGETITIGALSSSVAAFGRKRSAVTVAPDLPAIFSPVTSMELPAVCSADAPPAPAKMRARQMTIRQKSSTLRGFVSAAGPGLAGCFVWLEHCRHC